MLEKDIEARLVRGVKALGGLCYKFTSPGTTGVPDRVVILPGGRVIFVELKTRIGRLSEVQKYQTSEIKKRGAEVRVLKGLDQVKAFLAEVSSNAI